MRNLAEENFPQMEKAPLLVWWTVSCKSQSVETMKSKFSWGGGTPFSAVLQPFQLAHPVDLVYGEVANCPQSEQDIRL